MREERQGVLDQIKDTLETPLVVLGFIWLAQLSYPTAAPMDANAS